MPKVTNKLVQNGRAIFGPDPKNPKRLVALTGQRGRHSDGDGLYFVVGQKSEHRWAFLYKSRTRKLISGLPAPVEMGVGGAPDGSDKPALSLANARKRVKEFRAMLVNGLDPLAERDRLKAAAAPVVSDVTPVTVAAPAHVVVPGQKNITFGEYADGYFETHKHEWKNKVHVKQWLRSLTVEAEPLRAKMVRDIDTDDIVNLLRPIFEATYETGRRLQERLNRVLGAAGAEGYRDNTPSPARWKGHLSEVLPRKSSKPKKGHAALPYAEMPAFIRELNDKTSLSALALQFTIGTCARTNETIEARWDEIDFDAKLWTVPGTRMKGGREHRVPLTESMLLLLGEVRKFSHTGFIFAIGARGKPLSNAAMSELLKGMREPGIATVHGMRATFSTWANEETEHDSKIVDFCLAHINGDKAEAAYRRGTSLSKRRKVLDDWEKYLAG